jgi:ribonuclease HI
MSIINVYTDGSSRGNPGPGGYGIILKFGSKIKEISAGFRKTTNNRMELMAVCVALENLNTNKYPIVIHCDSKYVIDAITQKWVWNWNQKQFKGKKNQDLWLRYLRLHDQFNVSFVWVKGHAGHPENERCDELAFKAATDSPTNIDEFFESDDENGSLF